MVRFNEAIDQAIAESVADFSAEAEAWRQVFLGVLGHDLRGPLNVIMLTSELMSQMVTDTPYSEQTARLIKSGRRMNQLLDDLLDYSRTALGMGIRINRSETCLADALVEEVENLRIEFPGTKIELECSGVTEGEFDVSRVREALGNLVTNAVKYGTPNATVRIELLGGKKDVRLIVRNEGSPPTAVALKTMFEPLQRGSLDDDHSRTSLGLGLFIVREIAKAHGGEVSAEALDETTTFTMRLAKE